MRTAGVLVRIWLFLRSLFVALHELLDMLDAGSVWDEVVMSVCRLLIMLVHG